MPTSAASAYVAAADDLGQLANVPGPDVPGARFQRNDERQVLRRYLLGQQGDLRVAEDKRRDDSVGEHGHAGDDRCRHRPPTRAEDPADGRSEERTEHDLLRPDTEQSRQRTGRGADRDRPRPGRAADNPAERAYQRRSYGDALP